MVIDIRRGVRPNVVLSDFESYTLKLQCMKVVFMPRVNVTIPEDCKYTNCVIITQVGQVVTFGLALDRQLFLITKWYDLWRVFADNDLPIYLSTAAYKKVKQCYPEIYIHLWKLNEFKINEVTFF